MPIADSDFMKTARARFRLADEAETKQRERERSDLAFYAGDQWPADIKLLRQGQQPTNGMPAVPARPTEVFNTLREPVRQVLNEERQSDFGVQIVAADDFGDLGVTPDESEITLREGLVRRIQRQSSAADARTWAYMRAVIAGRGWYQVLTRYLPGKTFDQEVYVDRIYNQATVLVDPSHTDPAGADIEWGFVGHNVLWDKYKREHPTLADGSRNPLIAQLDGGDDGEWRTMHEEYPDWFRAGSDATGDDATQATRAVRVVDYWYTVSTSRELAILEDGTVLEKKDLGDRKAVQTRTEPRKAVKWAKIDGVNLLEETDWPTADIPLIKVLGEELQPYDHEQGRAEGMVRPSRGSQMGTNYSICRLLEMLGSTPLPPLQVDPEAIDGYEEWYKAAPTRMLPYLPSRTYDDYGRQFKEPHRADVNPNLTPLTQATALFLQFTEKTTAVPAAALGDIDPVTRSGKAITKLTQNAQRSTSNFLDNLVRSMRREAEIENNLLYPIYGASPGRIVRIMTGANESQTWRVHDGEPANMPAPPPNLTVHGSAKLTPDANFNIAFKISRNYDTRRQEEQTTVGEIIAKDPQYGLSVFGDIYFKNDDGPGHMELSERAGVMLAPPVQQYLAAKKRGGAFDPKDQQIQQLQQQLGQAHQIIQAKGAEKMAEYQGKKDIEGMKLSAEANEAAKDRAVKLYVAELEAKVDRLALLYQGLADTADMHHEAGMAHAQAGVDQSMQQQDAAMQQQQQAHEAQQATQQQSHDAAITSMQSPAPQPPEEPAPQGPSA